MLPLHPDLVQQSCARSQPDHVKVLPMYGAGTGEHLRIWKTVGTSGLGRTEHVSLKVVYQIHHNPDTSANCCLM
ncbi:hypothetical protein ILYODFUR_008392 [Ilyodon furcidens]|uniref:Uncharacterized protein n=1 Tax=Ilyodon furcidens TaxID=33524 RepID=A0ABV0T9P9_9TELE